MEARKHLMDMQKSTCVSSDCNMHPNILHMYKKLEMAINCWSSGSVWVASSAKQMNCGFSPALPHPGATAEWVPTGGAGHRTVHQLFGQEMNHAELPNQQFLPISDKDNFQTPAFIRLAY